MAATPQPDPSATETPDARNFDAGASSGASSPSPSPSPSPSANPQALPANAAGAGAPAPPVSLVSTPDVVKPAKRGGLAGMMDSVADAIAGTKGAGKVYTDPKTGDEYIEHPTLSRGQQWIKIAGEALRGAAAGAAVGRGPGGAQRGLEAGIEAGDKQQQQQQQQDRQQSQDVRQANQDRFNQSMLKMKMGAQEFELARMKVKATQDDINFAQGQEARMKGLMDEGKAFDLGSYSDEADLAAVKKAHPEFWKSFHNGDITGVPVMGPDGERKGVHVYLTTPGVGNEPQDGQQFHVFTPPVKPGDKPTLQTQTASGPMSPNQAHAYDLAAYGQMQKWQIDANTEAYKQQQTQTSEAEEESHRATAGEVNARAGEIRAGAGAKEAGKTGYVEKPDGTVWIANEGDAKAANLPFEEMKPGDINKDKQAMRQLNDVQLNTSRYTKAAQAYADPQGVLTYHGKPVSAANPVHPEGPLSLIGLEGSITDPQALRSRDNTNLNTLMNKAGYADINASISAGGHIEVPVITAFGQSLSRQVNSRAYNELSDQAKELYDGYVRTMASIPAYQKALTGIGRSNKEMLDLELANIAHPGMAPGDIVRKQAQFQENIDRATDGFPRNMVGVKHPTQTRREVEGPPPVKPGDIPGMTPMSTPVFRHPAAGQE